MTDVDIDALYLALVLTKLALTKNELGFSQTNTKLNSPTVLYQYGFIGGVWLLIGLKDLIPHSVF